MERKIIIKFKLKIIIYVQIRKEVFSHFFPEPAAVLFQSCVLIVVYDSNACTHVLIIFEENGEVGGAEII